MNMIRHQDEFVHLHSPLFSVVADYIQQKFAKPVRLQKEPAFEGREGDKERSDFLWCENQG